MVGATGLLALFAAQVPTATTAEHAPRTAVIITGGSQKFLGEGKSDAEKLMEVIDGTMGGLPPPLNVQVMWVNFCAASIRKHVVEPQLAEGPVDVFLYLWSQPSTTSQQVSLSFVRTAPSIR